MHVSERILLVCLLDLLAQQQVAVTCSLPQPKAGYLQEFQMLHVSRLTLRPGSASLG